MSGVEVVNIRNVNGTAAVAAVTEAATVTFSALAAGATVTIAGVTLTGGTGGSTAAQVASAFFANTNAAAGAAGAVGHAGTLTGYTIDATQPTATSVVVKSSTAGNVTDLSATGTGTMPAIAIVQGVAAVTSTGVTDTVAAGNFSGATEFNSVNSLNGVTFTGLATGAAVGQVGNGSVTNGALSFAYATATDAVNLNIAGGTRGTNAITNTGAGATVATINSTGAANTVGTVTLAAGATVKTLTINADANLTASGIANLTTDAAVTVKGAAASVSVGTLTGAKTIDASGLAGGVTATLDTVVTSFKGGAGNDTITSAALATNTAGVVDAGAGTADVLVVANSLTVDTAAEAANYVNFEVLRNSHNTDLDASLISGVTTLQVAGADAGFVKMSAGQAANIAVLATNTNNTFALTTATGTADVLGLTLANATAAAAATPIDVTGATVTGFETIKVVSSSGTKGGAAGAGSLSGFLCKAGS